MNIIRSGCGYGRDLRRTPLMTLKIAVLAPIPRAMVMTTTAVKPGLWRKLLNENRMSLIRFAISVYPLLG